MVSSSPVKYVNYAASADLDSTDAFEGPEKLLKVCFRPSEPVNGNLLEPSGNLLHVPRPVWETILDLVHCKVLSVVSTPRLHAYVLSESSMFVYPQQLVLKTCGTTTLLKGLDSILEVAREHGLDVSAVFYSRRSFLFPDKQLHPHGCWHDEVAQLRKYWPRGSSALFGTGPEQRWHLFAHVDEDVAKTSAVTCWLELMMTELDDEKSQQFHLNSSDVLEGSVLSLDSPPPSAYGCEPDDDDPGHLRGNIMTRSAGIDELFPSPRHSQAVDSFAFTPCGYSCNGVVDNDKYFTIHVTPERGSSYASFEANVPEPRPELVGHVLDVFGPKRFSLVSFDTSVAPEDGLPQSQLLSHGYVCTSEARLEVVPGLYLVHMTFLRS